LKSEILERLAAFERDLRALRASVRRQPRDRVSHQSDRDEADRLATYWVEELRSPLEHKFMLATEVIADMSELMKRLHVLSRPNNRKSSYEDVLKKALSNFKNRFVLPIQQATFEVESLFDLRKLVTQLSDAEDSEYLQEAVDCANAGFRRAAVVLGWCAVVDRMQRKIQSLGFASFNAASVGLKNQSTGKYKRWNKNFSISSLSDLQEVFDRDLVIVIEAMGLLDGNEAERLYDVDLRWRNQSAHPGSSPIEDPHVVAFFTDIVRIVLASPTFDI